MHCWDMPLEGFGGDPAVYLDSSTCGERESIAELLEEAGGGGIPSIRVTNGIRGIYHRQRAAHVALSRQKTPRIPTQGCKISPTQD